MWPRKHQCRDNKNKSFTHVVRKWLQSEVLALCFMAAHSHGGPMTAPWTLLLRITGPM